MKKAILICNLAMLFTFNASAQSKQNAVPAPGPKPKAIEKFYTDDNLNINYSKNKKQPVLFNQQQGAKKASTVTKLRIGTSWNQYSVLLEEQTCVSAIQEMNMIGFAHRSCVGYPVGNYPDGTPSANGAGHVQMSFSTNYGLTWDTSVVITSDGNRYPSGVLYNPTGNMVPTNAFGVVAGPALTDATASGAPCATWCSDFLASARLDKSFINENYVTNLYTGNSDGTPTFFGHRNYMSAGDDSIVHICGSDYTYAGAGTAYNFTGLVVSHGKYNKLTNNFVWTSSKHDHIFATDPADGSDEQSTSGMAWSQDGQTGYIIHIGRDKTSDFKSPMPIVYKSTTNPPNWVLQPLFDFSGLTDLTDSLVNVSGTAKPRPFFSPSQGIDFVVDKFGNLHIITVVLSAFSNNADSLGFVYTYSGSQQVFDVYTSSDGSWHAEPIGVIWAANVADATGCNLQNGIGYSARLQASRTADGSKILCSWLDTDPGLAAENCYPDIYAWGMDIMTAKKTNVINFTQGTAYAFANYWLYASGTTLQNGTTFIIPTTTSEAGANDLAPMTHFYVQGIEFHQDSFYIPTKLSPPSLVAQVINLKSPNCNGGSDGESAINVTGGTPPYTYAWNDPGSQTDSAASGLIAGNYTVVASDSAGNTDTVFITITEPAALAADTVSVSHLPCFGLSNGAIDVSVAGGTTPYTYSWSNGDNVQDADSISGGTYKLTVTDANGCVDSISVVVNEPAAVLAIGLSGKPDTCNRGDGAVMVSSVGGTSPYTYLWNDSGSSTNDTVVGLSSGLYIITVTDANGCDTVNSVTVVAYVSGIVIDSLVSENASSCTVADGKIVSFVTGGKLPYTYLWNDTASQTNDTALGLSGGNIYNLLVTDSMSCTATGNEIVNSTGAHTVAIDSTKDVSCKLGTDGVARVAATGGTPPYTYVWSGGANPTDSLTGGLVAGTYNVTVVDAALCKALATVTITEPAAISNSISIIMPACFTESNGKAIAAVTGGTPGYTYLWNDAGSQTNDTASGLPAATYVVTVTDAKGCIKTDTAVVGQPLDITIDTTVTNVSCFSGNDGAIDISVTGGTIPYTYVWFPGPNTGQDANLLTNGTYTITVTDKNGCQDSATVSISQPTAELVVTVTSVKPDSASTSAGGIQIDVVGGTMPYAYIWNPGSKTTEDLAGVTTGNYTVTVTDNKGCKGTATAFVSNIVGISAISADPVLFSIFPNPNTGRFVLELNGAENNTRYELEIRNIIGAIIYKETISGVKSGKISKHLDLSDKNKGIYFVNITSTKGTKTVKLVID